MGRTILDKMKSDKGEIRDYDDIKFNRRSRNSLEATLYFMLDKYPDYRIVCLDCLTMRGNLSTLAPVMENLNFRFVKERSRHHEAVTNYLKRAPGYHRELRGRKLC